MLVGAGGAGKTHALAQLAISIATGTNWLGKFPIEQPGFVFMGLGENAARRHPSPLAKNRKRFIQAGSWPHFL